jgi:hypothetical protein
MHSLRQLSMICRARRVPVYVELTVAGAVVMVAGLATITCVAIPIAGYLAGAVLGGLAGLAAHLKLQSERQAVSPVKDGANSDTRSDVDGEREAADPGMGRVVGHEE